MRDFLHKAYCATYRLPDWMTQIKLAGLLRRVIMYAANIYVAAIFRKPTVDEGRPQSDVIISLTSFPLRITYLWIVIECLLRQSVRPRKIILWLSKQQFSGIECLPERLLKQRERGLDIRFVDGDIRSHKKYYYAFKEYPDFPVLLVDDDILYDSHLVEDLLKDFSKDKIHCSYAYLIKHNNKGEPKPYVDWQPVYIKHGGSKDMFFGSGGGTLLVPAMLWKDATDIDLALKLCPIADDVWLNAMVRLAALNVIKVRNECCLSLMIKDNKTLASTNQVRNHNDVQIKALNDYYVEHQGVYLL